MSVTSQFDIGVISITQSYDIYAQQSEAQATPYLNTIGQEYIESYIQLEKVVKFIDFTFTAAGITEGRYLEVYYRVSRNGNQWTTWLPLIDTQVLQGLSEGLKTQSPITQFINFPKFDPMSPMYIDIKFVRVGTNEDGEIRLLSYKLVGELLKSSDEDTVNVSPASETVITTPFIYKVFKITDFEVLGQNTTNINIKYRFSQDNSRTWSAWEPLTKENISTVRINPVRFFQIEYLVTNTGNTNAKIQDINLIGDFQNVTQDYQKTNLYGIRDCCQSVLLGTSNGVLDENGNLIPNTTGVLDSQSCTSGNVLKSLTAEDKSKLYNPYQQSSAMNLLNKLSNDSMEIFGWRVKYFATDPDGKGIDYTLHEYQLYNIVCEEEIKVAVENNSFPDNQIVMNQFDLTLFDAFEIHITKQSFKEAFGVQRRPSKEDLVYFCDINRMFIVDHAQQFRNFNNAAIYYKVVLKKYNKSANVLPGTKLVEDKIKELTKNTTINELFGVENDEDKASIANKPQQQTLTREPIRLEYTSSIVKELIENSITIVSKQHYDFAPLLYNEFSVATQSVAAVKYKQINHQLKVSDNLGFFLWFNVNNYIADEEYNFFTNYSEYYDSGWKLNLKNDNIRFNINADTYTFSFTGSTNSTDSIYENVWYCYLLNVDQRNRKIDQYLYKRMVDIDQEDQAKYLSSTELELVYQNSQDFVPQSFEIQGVDATIFASDLKMTNIRLFSEIIPESQHNKILNQYIIADDSKYLIFADNANQKLILPNFPFQ
jgi:hypothetical protein